jgi:uncharacterized protein (TIGR02466 family)
MTTREIFPTQIYVTQYPGDIGKLQHDLLPKVNSLFESAMTNNQSSMRGNGICSYNTTRDLNLDPAFSNVVKFINSHAEKYWQALQYDSSMCPKVYEMWANIYKPNSFIETHNHSPIHMTASFYLQQPDNGGNIMFEHPNSTLLKHQPYAFDQIRYTAFEQEVAVTTGTLVIFPGYMNHRTQPNMSTDNRIIIGSNICNVS